MADIETTSGPIYFEAIDLTAPWVERPETVLFHHGVGTTADIWSGWLSVLAADYKIVRFDLRGFGRSPAPPEGYAWTLEGLVEDLMAVADAAEVARFHLVGESAGGTAALYAAANRAKRVLTATGVSCTHIGASINRVREWWGKIEVEGMAAWSAEMMERRFYPGVLPTALHRWFESEQSAGSPAAVLGLAEMLIGADLSDDLGRISCPVLLLAPDASPFVATEVTAAMHHLIPVSEMHIFSHTRHGLACSHGRQCAELLKSFLARHGDAAAAEAA